MLAAIRRTVRARVAIGSIEFRKPSDARNEVILVLLAPDQAILC